MSSADTEFAERLRAMSHAFDKPQRQECIFAQAYDRMSAIIAERDRLREELAFYADPASWQTSGHPQIDSDLAPIRQDRGARAREALAL